MIFLHLFHGRTSPSQEMPDWGDDGPTLKATAIHTTYGTHVRLQTFDERWHDFPEQDGCLFYNGRWYGDWSVFSRRSDPALAARAESFLPGRALYSPVPQPGARTTPVIATPYAHHWRWVANESLVTNRINGNLSAAERRYAAALARFATRPAEEQPPEEEDIPF